ncbi:MAG TPA: hypothetical protein PKJ14_06655 [Candidatus Cloacimonadota bacterium]|nr:hypothetical protein [Candidatus Cloacimonadota bacterium]HQL14856.1 hypothetical protein [Candidatus Cloacimonadota bacterium]
MKKVIFILLIAAVIYILPAQTNIFNSGTNNLNSSVSSSLFNPYKLKMSHSMGFYTGSSGSGLSFYESRYTNHIFYEFNPKLNLALDLNFVNFGTAMNGKGFSFESNGDNQTKIFPEFSLNYKPTDAISIRFEYRNLNSFDRWYQHNAFDW